MSFQKKPVSLLSESVHRIVICTIRQTKEPQVSIAADRQTQSLQVSWKTPLDWQQETTCAPEAITAKAVTKPGSNVFLIPSNCANRASTEEQVGNSCYLHLWEIV